MTIRRRLLILLAWLLTLYAQASHADIFETRRSIEGRFKPSGAVGDGATNCAAALAATTLHTILPAGDYRISTNCTIAPTVQFMTGAKLIVDAGVIVTFTKSIIADPLQQIFSLGAGARVLLTQEFSICWFGALRDNTGDVGVFLQQAVDCAANPSAGGYATRSGSIFFPPGRYRCSTAVSYKGQVEYGLVLRGSPFSGIFRGGVSDTRSSMVNWHGTNRTFLRYEGANGSTFEDLVITSEAGVTCQEVVWLDAINGDVGATVDDDPSSGVAFRRCVINIGAADCALTTACLAIGHPHGAGASSQVSEISCYTLYCTGQSTNKGIGVEVREDGNTKVMSFDRLLATGLNKGVKWAASSYMQLNDCSFGLNDLDIEQIGAGNLNINNCNSEGSSRFLVQTAGTGGCSAIINCLDWQGLNNTAGAKDIITVRGQVSITNSEIRCSAGASADTIPWIAFTNSPLVTEDNHAALFLDGVIFGNSYSDFFGVYNKQAPIRDGSGNPIYQSSGVAYVGAHIPLFVRGCVSLENGGTVTKIVPKLFQNVQLLAMTTAQRDALAVYDGLLILNTTTGKVQARAAGAWVDLH